MIDYANELNKEQYEAVVAGDGPILVIAGAGSGKTRTLTYRVAHLIESGVEPERILLATFTNKAAREMLSRVEKLTGVDVSRLWGGTFHHIANVILRREGHLIGIDRNFAIVDEEDANQIVNSCIIADGNRSEGGRISEAFSGSGHHQLFTEHGGYDRSGGRTKIPDSDALD